MYICGYGVPELQTVVFLPVAQVLGVELHAHGHGVAFVEDPLDVAQSQRGLARPPLAHDHHLEVHPALALRRIVKAHFIINII